MTMLGTEAWITSAVEDGSVNKALVLAGSLRRVHTGKKLVVVTSFGVAQELREKLKDAFDLVVLIEQDNPNGINLEDYAKVEGFSLLIFHKCVYLSPNTVVLRNCDGLFEKYDNFAVLKNGMGVDSSVFLFTPSVDTGKALRNFMHHAESHELNGDIGDNFSKHFNKWIQNNIPKLEKLDEDYNTLIHVEDGCSKSVSSNSNISIVNFGDIHPLDLAQGGNYDDNLNGSGGTEKILIDFCQQILVEDVKPNNNLYTELSLDFDVFKKEPIAIVGMSFRLPGGNNADEFWNLLVNGREGITPLPPNRWKKEHTIWPRPNKNIEAGFLTVPVDEFDPEFFGVTEKEAEFMDPQARLLHEVAWEALEDAMVDPKIVQGTKTGVFVGSWLQDYQDMLSKDGGGNLLASYMGSSIAAGAAGLSHHLGVRGPTVGTESGCSSAIVAVDMACKSLQSGESTMALACGVNLLLHPFDYETLNVVLSPDGRCKTFDEGANGFARAEGCVVLLLKRLSDATREGDNIWGLIRGSAATQEGVSKSLGTPTIHCESLAMELALKDAGVDPLDVSYVEAHGTGTPVGDPMEIAAITKAYGKRRSKPLIIGSVKTNVGHTESVSGITGIVKVLLSMKNEVIPKHLNLEKLNPAINLEAIPAKIPMEAMAWPKQIGKPRIAGVSSFGISGTDGHTIIQEPPIISKPKIHRDKDNVRPLHIMKISAKSPESIKKLLMTYESIFEAKEEENGFADVAYSANVGRATFNHRAVIIAKDFKEAKHALMTKSFKHADVKSNKGQLCFIFNGEGSQYPNMGSTLYANSPVFRNEFNKCDQFLMKQCGINLPQYLWGTSSYGSDMDRTIYNQVAKFCIDYSLLKLWESWGVKPDYVIGHGMGEYTAAVAAGALGFADALTLIIQRNRWTDKMKKSIDGKIQPSLAAFRREVQKLKPFLVGKDGPKYISGMLGRVVPLETLGADHWVKHVTTEPRSYQDAYKLARSEGCSLFLQLSPHPSHSSSSMSSFESLPSILENGDEWATMLESLAQLFLSEWKGEIDWKGFDSGYHRSRVPLPFYPFNRRPIWKELESILPAAHPLLGRPFPSASSSNIFEKGLTLKNTPFTLDHVIGNTVVFPGAGFMEMCLAGGHATQHGISSPGELKMPQGPVTMKFLKIAAPLGLYDTGVCRLQTIIKLDKLEGEDEVNSYSVGINRYVPSSSGGMGDWTCHATATFIPEADTSSNDTTFDIDIPSIQSSWEKQDNSDFYEKLPEVGLRFGPKFQSLEMGWKSEEGILLSVKIPEDNDDGYLIHPIVADAMLQATMLWTSRDKLKMKLQVPVQIGQFTWLQTTTSSRRFIYCGTTTEGTTTCILLDEWGRHLARMMDVDFIETTVKLVEGMLSQQGKAMPKLWSEVWRNVPGALQKAYDLTATNDIPLLQLTEEKQRYLAEKNDVGEYERSFYQNLCNLARLYFIHAMYDLGWKPKEGVPFHAEDLIKLLLRPKEHFKRYIRFFLRSISETGLLTEVTDEEDKYYFPGPPPTQGDLDEGLAKVISPEDCSRVEYQIIVTGGKNLAEVFRGNVEPLQLLFPEDPNQVNAADLYTNLCNWIKDIVQLVMSEFSNEVMNAGCDAYMKVHKAGSALPILRLLEIGAGTGSNSKSTLEFLDKSGKPYEYYYTDVSASFFISAEKNFEKYLKNMVFKKFNMEEDPLEQGFCPGYFDVITATEVLHIAKDIRKTLRNLKTLLKPCGVFQIIETTTHDPRITAVFGMLEGYWQFEDLDFRPYHTTLTPEKWEEALRGVGCDTLVCTPAYNNIHSVISARLAIDQDTKDALEKPQNSWMIFYHDETEPVATLLEKKLAGVNRKVHAVKRPLTCTESDMKELVHSKINSALEEVERIEGVLYLWGLQDDAENRDQSQISLPLITLAQEMLQCKSPPRFYVVTRGSSYVEGGEVTCPSTATLHGIIKTLSNETVGLHWSCLDLSPDNLPVDQIEDIFGELWWTDKGNRIIAFRDGQRLFSKLASAKVHYNEPLTLPGGCDRFQLVLPKTRLISDLEFGVLENYNLEEDEIEVQIKAIALNFRDIFVVLKPIKQFEELNSVGLDFAGVITKVGPKVTHIQVGDRVIGLNTDPNLALPSHIKSKEQYVVPLPASFTFEEGVTLPAVFSTALLCLLNVAKMKRGDTVLIHTASGGVGLCAIQLAKQVSANVIATAGSKRKRNYLRNLGIKHVFHSRTTDFGKQILEVTNGKGVDIVLNSITGEGFKEASLSALTKGGWFVEMSKLNVWTPEEVKELRPDVSYEVVDLTTMDRSEAHKLIEKLQEFISDNKIRPIAYERFDAVNIRGALNYLQKAKHIGKIVCRMPEVRIENSKINATTPLFNELSTYLVTGGLGGIGFEVVKWMLSSGAKHIAIASRSQPKPEIASQLESWNKNGKHVQAFTVDVGDYDQCEQLFQTLGIPSHGFPKLRGVMHAAGTLSDGIMENQTWDKFRHTYNPKVNGSWNLHDLTKDLLLEHFVVFSSMTASFGTPGQANHAASNCFEDALAAYRRSQGLSATTVNWGNWGEVGVATELDFPGIRPISTAQGLLALETFLKIQTSHLNVVNLDSCALAVKLIPNLKSFVDDKRLFGELKTTIIINSDDFWKDVDNCEDREGKLLVFKDFIKSTLKNILKMDQDEVIDDLTEFQSLGIDSLMMLEMKNGLQNILGSRMTLTATQLKDCNNTEILANRLVDILEGNGDVADIVLPTKEELMEMIREDSILPAHIKPSEGMETGAVSRILLTGATGMLGPYLLRDVSLRPNITKIYCSIRKSGNVSPLERLLKRLKATGLDEQVDMSKVECIHGDITEDKLGLSDEEYNRLAGSVDAIINSAVRADHTAKYWRSPETRKSDIRTVNVKGTVRLLEFAVHSKLKHVYHASTILLDTTTNVDGSLSEEWQDVGALDQFASNSGYVISKHVGEQLCKQAVERGIPCKAFRHPYIAGDSNTGRCDYLTNHIVLRWMAYLKLRCMPDLPSPLVAMPVDLCSKISLDIFFNGNAPADVYNIIHKDGGMDQTLIDVAEGFGIHVQPVSISEFMAKLKSESEDSPLAAFKKMYEEEEETAVQNWESNLAFPAMKQYVEDSSNFFRSRKLPQLIPYYDELESTEEVMRRDLQFLKESGVFEKFGINN